MDWDLLTRVVAGDGTPADGQVLDFWLAESPEHAELLAAVRELALEPGTATPPERLSELLVAAKRGRPIAATEADAPAPKLGVVQGNRETMPRFAMPRHVRVQRVARLAVVGLVLAGALAGGTLLLRSSRSPLPVPSPSSPNVLTTARGQRLNLRLSDGTLATLAPSTTLRVAPGYGGRSRAVEIEGEAAFTVVHDSTRAFTVRVAGVLVRDLGTRFVVRGYPGEPTTDVVVAEGRVTVHRTRGAADSLVVARGDRARAIADGGMALTRGVALDRYFAWTEGRLVFEETPLREVVAQLDRWYDIDIRLVPANIGDRKVSASVEDEPPNDVLGMLAASLGLDLSRTDRVYTLRIR